MIIVDRWDFFLRKWRTIIDKEREAEVNFHKKEILSLDAKDRERRGRCLITNRFSFHSRVGEEFLYVFFSPFSGPSEIKEGSVVLVTQYGKDPIKYGKKGVVWEKRRNAVIVGLKSRLRKQKYRIDLFVDETTFKRMEEALDLIRGRLKALLLKTTNPYISKRTFTPFNPRLNEFQKAAVSKALGSELTLIHGPFGTGKTTVLEEIVRQFLKEGKRILVAADSNTAVDNLMERLSDVNGVRVGHPSRVKDVLIKKALIYKLEEHPYFSRIKALRKALESLKEERKKYLKPTSALRRGMSDDVILKVAKRGKAYRGLSEEKIKSMANWIFLSKDIERLHKEIVSLREKAEKEIISNAKVVFATASTSFSEVLASEKFDVVVFDEATQSTLPSTLMALVHADKWVLAGDHKQLPPTVLSEDKELKVSLFERWIKAFPEAAEMLRVQYRMNEVLMSLANELFYEGKLKAHESVKDISVKDICPECPEELAFPVHFVDVGGVEKSTGGFSKHNIEEVRVVEYTLRSLISLGLREEDIGVITPYKEQRDLIQKVALDFPGVEVSTVDGFQGREKEVILLSLVRSNLRGDIGFLKDYRRLNVAITRARRLLIAFGDKKTLSKDKVYADFLSRCKVWDEEEFKSILRF